MSDTKHTPGPWSLEYDGSLVMNNQVVASKYTVAPDGATVGEQEANIKLIAAAPELLDALYTALNLEGTAKAGTAFGAFRGFDIKYHFDKIRKAIAKAEGRSE